jgi:hypothetical protein
MATYRETVQIFLQISEFTQTLPKAVILPLLCQVRMHPQKPMAKYCESEQILTRSSPRLTACVRAKYTASSIALLLDGGNTGPQEFKVESAPPQKTPKPANFDPQDSKQDPPTKTVFGISEL